MERMTDDDGNGYKPSMRVYTCVCVCAYACGQLSLFTLCFFFFSNMPQTDY